MASIRRIKKDIDYLTSELISDGYMALYFNGADKRADIIAVIEEAVALRNSLYERANNPVEKHNKSLVKKHYAQIRREMLDGIDALFEKLSTVCK